MQSQMVIVLHGHESIDDVPQMDVYYTSSICSAIGFEQLLSAILISFCYPGVSCVASYITLAH